jgi:hypothetical protein
VRSDGLFSGRVVKHFRVSAICFLFFYDVVRPEIVTYNLASQVSETRPGKPVCREVPTDRLIWQALIDFSEDTGDRIRIEHGVDFIALSDHDQGQVQWNRAIGGESQRCSSAIPIDGISPGGRNPTGI